MVTAAELRTHSRAFAHGFVLPLQLGRAVLRDAELRGPYLRLFAARSAFVVLACVVAAMAGEFDGDRPKSHEGGIVVRHDPGSDAGAVVRLDLPGLHIDVDPSRDAGRVELLGKDLPVDLRSTADAGAEGDAKEEEDHEASLPPAVQETLAPLRRGWTWLLAVLAFLSTAEAIAVFVSRRYDDWIAFYSSALLHIHPDDDAPKPRRLAFDLPWLWRKSKEKLRGYVLFAFGVPLLWLFSLLPTIGGVLSTVLGTAWGWYWLGVFTAGKSGHAWTLGEAARSPLPVRVFVDGANRHRLFAPARSYGRFWTRATSDIRSPSTTFERHPAAFLGLALSRALLALPGLYLLARPLIPVAAGRLCAEVDASGALWQPEPRSFRDTEECVRDTNELA